MDDPNPCPPPPPIVINDEFIWSTPVVYGPTLLLIITLFIGIPRYIFVKTNYHLHAESLLHQLSSFSKVIIYLCLFITLSFVFDAIVVISRAIFASVWTSSELAFYIAISWLSWVISLVFLFHESQVFGKWYWTQYIFWEAAFLTETLVGWLWLNGVTRPKEGTQLTAYDHFSFGIFVTRYLIEILLVILSCIHLISINGTITRTFETSPLLGSSTVIKTKHKTRYGAAVSVTTSVTETRTYKGYFQNLKRILPFVWPQKDFKLQFYFVTCFVFMIFGFIVNVLAPLQIGIVVDQLKNGNVFWSSILFFVGLRFLQGGSGLLQTIQNWLWLPIGQRVAREISLSTFTHLHHLSLNFHISRKTGEALRAMDRGTSSVITLLNHLVFQIFPIWVNIILISIFTACIYTPLFGLILFLTMSLYVYVTVTVTERRTKFRKKMKDLENHATSRMVDSLLNFETVKYYNAEDYEATQYKYALVEYQRADWKSSVSLNALNLAQNAIITGGLLSGCLLFAHAIAKNQLSVGDFVAFLFYLLQLYAPLHWFGTYYGMIQLSLIDTEKMFALLDEVTTVKDVPNARDIFINEGEIVFENVTFSYDGRQNALNGASFRIPKGKSVALVGPTGGGKSTILRLLFRFFDVESGRIYVDGQDIRKVTQSSLRKNIGVISQETVLFNESIYYNINYGNVHASREDVIRAAKEAHLHQKIETFADGYNTKVGERGLKLSSSEKQRIAIARTILKNPPIVLLDEATGSLDSTNERYIQQALTNLTKGRTTLRITNRLTTTVNADLILVVKDGKVVESGTHEELINRALVHGEKGVYFEMWQKQLHEDTSETFSEVTHSTISNSTIDESSTPALITKKKSSHRHHHSQQSKQQESIEVEEHVVHTQSNVSSQAQLELIELDEEEEATKRKSKHRHHHSQQSKQHESIEVEERVVHIQNDESSQAQLESIELDEEEEAIKKKSSSRRFF